MIKGDYTIQATIDHEPPSYHPYNETYIKAISKNIVHLDLSTTIPQRYADTVLKCLQKTLNGLGLQQI
jgi:hypothetical protein